MTVQRFNPVASAAISLSEQGEYVKYEDYEKLAAKLSMINGLMEAAEQVNKLAQEATEKLVQERDALAAENAHMQQVIGEVQILYYESDGIVGYHLNGEVAKWDDVMPDLWAETPATDAFLAEVRAQGVDVAIEHLHKKFEGTGQIGVPVIALEWLAQELQKGAAQ